MLSTQSEPTDKALIEAIRAGGPARDNAWRHIAENWGAYCCNTAIKKTECSRKEAAEAFSIAVVGVDKRIRSTEGQDFLKTATLKTYLSTATKYAAWAILRRQKKYVPLSGEESGSEVGNWFHRERCREIMEKALAGIGDRCKKILMLFNDGFSMKEITAEMSFTNEDSAKKEKYKCQVKFMHYLVENPSIRNQLELNCYG